MHSWKKPNAGSSSRAVMPEALNNTAGWGLIAGNGRFPFLVLEGARSQGIEMAVIALKEEASPDLEKVAKRLALTLLRLLKRVGKPGRAGMEISLTREELAQMTGTTLFTISRILSGWAEKGVVQPRRQGVVINDPAKLEMLDLGDDD